jgi:excisionase family DNA binding protein
MITVPQAAERVGRDPETIRRWIRAGRLRARKVGTQHIVDEADLDQVAGEATSLPLPTAWQRTWTGEAPPDWVRILRRSRRSR